MAISDGFKAIGPAWASAVGADRTAPNDPSLTPMVTPADGWPASFSSADGNTPRRAVFNELLHRFDSALLDIRNHGVLPYDAAVDTLAGGVRQVDGVLYRATVNVGPAYSNAVSPTAPGQTVWAQIVRTLDVPSTPSGLAAWSPPYMTVSAESERLDPYDSRTASGGGGSRVDCRWNPVDDAATYDFRWRSGSAAWTLTEDLTAANSTFTVPSAQSTNAVEIQVRAVNTAGTSAWSPSVTIAAAGNAFDPTGQKLNPPTQPPVPSPGRVPPSATTTPGPTEDSTRR